ncbi:MAG: hypothetical protein R3C51_09755 [Parvularculaceae bacterium]
MSKKHLIRIRMSRAAAAKALAGMAALAIVGAAASAQTRDPQSETASADALRARLEADAITRPRIDPPPVGQNASEVIGSRVQWTEVQTSIDTTRRLDVSRSQTVTAVLPRAPGVRVSSPSAYQLADAREVARPVLPVLVPESADLANTLKIYGQTDTYSAIGDVAPGVAMRMSGARRKLVVGDARAARVKFDTMRKSRTVLPGLDAPYLITRSELSTDISFSKYGCGYVLSLMCDDPDGDARCAGDEYIVALASKMSLLNPGAGDRQ